MADIVAYEDHIKAYEFDPVVGWRGIPNITVEYAGPDGNVSMVHHNAIGNRDDEHSLEKTKPRIAVLGASMTWAQGVGVDDGYVRHLARRMPQYEWMNFAHCNYGLDQCLVALKEKAIRYRPDAVIVEQHPWVLYRLLLRTLKGYPKPAFSLRPDGGIKFHPVPALARFGWFRSMLNDYRLFYKELLDEMNGIEVEKNYDPEYDPMFSLIKQDYYSRLYEIVELLLKELRSFCDQQKIKLLVVASTVVYEMERTSPCKLIDYSLPRQRFRRGALKTGVSCLDLHDPVLAALKSGVPAIFPGDGHWTPEGHQLVADQISDWIERTRWL